MPDMPARPATPRRDPGAADDGTLVAMGRMPEPPEPSPDPPRRPGAPFRPAPGPPPGEMQHKVLLLTALSDAGVPLTPREVAAVDAVATLDAATVTTVAALIRRGRPDTAAPPETPRP